MLTFKGGLVFLVSLLTIHTLNVWHVPSGTDEYCSPVPSSTYFVPGRYGYPSRQAVQGADSVG
jgi:hypothetical protein